jgi:chlorite dismutase/nitrite reductase/ring-hydroxylating ferredoxin subunit
MRPQHTNGSPSETDRAAKLTKRQYVRFAFYKLDPLWRRLPADKQAAHKRELRDTIEGFNKRMLLRPYSLMGTRADAEILLWQIAETPMHFQELATAIMRTGMGAYLNMVYSYFSQTKRSIYQIRDNPADDEERLIIQPSEAKYLFVYPFIKSRDWYQLSFHARQGMMDEHIVVGREFPSVKLNTTYSFGVDDYEFIVAFETDEPSDFLDLVQKLRETEVSRYTVQDTPLFNCINMRLIEALDALGGPPVAEPVIPEEQHEAWTDVGPLSEFGPGSTKVVYLEGKQIALFNVNGSLYALANRCSHARGPLSEGELDESACTVTCPWHYAKYDLASGRVVDGVASAPVESYQIEVRDGIIWVGTKMPEPAL